ncbi:hypothetical protein EST38_g3684 [Candolleomyces aberdarensis]|uniref:Cytochrome P450 n=1 Tax=Candolleomyces aberdarensis TaxID=2316362 RepID=A0A4Q2DPT1_9AGAR|nr:hypothetical protein EST38_g3684 [Candolleomyces aberdarensis]
MWNYVDITLGLVVISLLYGLSKRLKRSKLLLPPGPKGAPLIENLLQLPTEVEWRQYHEWCKEYNTDILYLNIAGKDIMVFDTSKTATDLLENRSSLYSSRPHLSMVIDLVGCDWQTGVLTYGMFNACSCMSRRVAFTYTSYVPDTRCNQYDASGDMCRYLQRRFQAISSRTSNPQWFTQRDIDTLVEAASGQFIYVATAFKYISERRGSPAGRLKIVLTWTPHDGRKTRPFEALDILYRNILSTAKNAYDAVDTNSDHEFLLLFRTHHINIAEPLPSWYIPANALSILLGLEAGAEDGLFSDLRSLLTFERNDAGDLDLHMYHTSFSDFLGDESRAKDLFVPHSRVYTHVAKCCMQNIMECSLDPDSCVDTVRDDWEDAGPKLPQYLEDTIDALPYFLREAKKAGGAIDDEVADFAQRGGWRKLDGYLSAVLPQWDGYSRRSYFPYWIESFQRFIDYLTPEAGEFAEK